MRVRNLDITKKTLLCPRQAEPTPDGGESTGEPRSSAIPSPGKHQSLFVPERQLVLVIQQPGTAQRPTPARCHCYASKRCCSSSLGAQRTAPKTHRRELVEGNFPWASLGRATRIQISSSPREGRLYFPLFETPCKIKKPALTLTSFSTSCCSFNPFWQGLACCW